MTRFIDAHRGQYGVEPICRELPIAPSTYYESKAREADRSRLPARAHRDAQLREHIARVWAEHYQRCCRRLMLVAFGGSTTPATSGARTFSIIEGVVSLDIDKLAPRHRPCAHSHPRRWNRILTSRHPMEQRAGKRWSVHDDLGRINPAGTLLRCHPRLSCGRVRARRPDRQLCRREAVTDHNHERVAGAR